jgi:heme-degrading monooxygenase HmoA
MIGMIEVHVSYDLVSGADDKAYEQWMKRAIVPVLKSEGIVEVRAYRNLLGSPQVLVVLVWKSLADWARIAEGSDWGALINELRSSLATHLRIDIWGPSPVVPEPVHPK